jgi:hypothetical protein
MTVPGSVGLVFFSRSGPKRQGVDSALFVRGRNWRAGRSATCALVLTCALGATATARQSSTSDSSGTTATPRTSHKQHKPTAASATTKSGTTYTASAKHTSHKKKSTRVRGQQKIDSERAQAIQQALIREHYLSGEATGTWNQSSEEAMRRYQADHGWQSKTVPDSRALIKLGLGPSKDHLLNPESAMTTVPDAPKAESMPTTSNTTPAVADPTPPASNSSNPQ